MQVHVLRSTERLYQSAASWIAAEMIIAVQNRGSCSIALSGGNTPKNVYNLLAREPFRNDIPWDKIFFFWGDERMVPFDDDQNNAKMAFENLLDLIPVKKENIFRMPSTLQPAAAEREYDELLRQHFSETEFSFDIVLLGMGDDGHTLSLFPGTTVLDEKEKWVTAYYVEKQKQYRITLLPRIVNRCRNAAFIVSGKEKASAFHSVVTGQRDEKTFPSQLIHPINGELHWFVDESVTAVM